MELRETHGYRVNRKVVARLHRLWDLPLRRTSPNSSRWPLAPWRAWTSPL
ncbi:hypothetical protein [Candidatus Palauibacter sp.]